MADTRRCRVLFSCRPAFGHVYPLLPLATAARDAGHHVTFATAGPFLARLSRLGFAVVEVGPTIDEAVADLLAELGGQALPRDADGRPELGAGSRLFLGVIAPRAAADLAALLPELRPDVVVYEQYDVGAAVAAHAAGIRAVCHSLSPRLPGDVLEVFGRPFLDRLWADHPPTSPDRFDVFTGDAYLDLFPSALQSPEIRAHPARVAIRPVPVTEPGATAPAWIGSRRRPLVYVTLGTIVAVDDGLRPAIEGLSTLDADVLVALGAASGRELGTLPANVCVEPFVDQPAVLRHAALAVHHGGSGTLLGALLNGVPQIVLPKGADQFANADLVTQAGLADVLEPRDATADAIATAAKIALESEHPAVEAARAELAAMPVPAEVLHVLASP